jgi:hypothetical protein
MGYYGTSGNFNVAVGHAAMQFNTAGGQNVAVGKSALANNRTGFDNTGLGHQANWKNRSGIRNVSIGIKALEESLSGYGSVAVGSYALQKVTLAGGSFVNSNTAVGNEALRYTTTGTFNNAHGAYALRCNTTGACNNAFGNRALRLNTTGSCHIAIGNNAQCGLNANVNNTITIGTDAATSATTGHTVWGNSGNNVCNCVYAAWSNVSDCRDKANVRALPDNLGIEFIRRLRPVAFNWDHRETYVRQCGVPYGEKDGTLIGTKDHYGLIAQELHQVIEEMGVRFDALGMDQDRDAYRLAYEELIAPMIRAIQDIDNRLSTLEQAQI